MHTVELGAVHCVRAVGRDGSRSHVDDGSRRWIRGRTGCGAAADREHVGLATIRRAVAHRHAAVPGRSRSAADGDRIRAGRPGRLSYRHVAAFRGYGAAGGDRVRVAAHGHASRVALRGIAQGCATAPAVRVVPQGRGAAVRRPVVTDAGRGPGGIRLGVGSQRRGMAPRRRGSAAAGDVPARILLGDVAAGNGCSRRRAPGRRVSRQWGRQHPAGYHGRHNTFPLRVHSDLP